MFAWKKSHSWPQKRFFFKRVSRGRFNVLKRIKAHQLSSKHSGDVWQTIFAGRTSSRRFAYPLTVSPPKGQSIRMLTYRIDTHVLQFSRAQFQKVTNGWRVSNSCNIGFWVTFARNGLVREMNRVLGERRELWSFIRLQNSAKVLKSNIVT